MPACAWGRESGLPSVIQATSDRQPSLNKRDRAAATRDLFAVQQLMGPQRAHGPLLRARHRRDTRRHHVQPPTERPPVAEGARLTRFMSFRPQRREPAASVPHFRPSPPAGNAAPEVAAAHCPRIPPPRCGRPPGAAHTYPRHGGPRPHQGIRCGRGRRDSPTEHPARAPAGPHVDHERHLRAVPRSSTDAGPSSLSGVKENVPGLVRAVIGGLFGRKYRREVTPVWR